MFESEGSRAPKLQGPPHRPIWAHRHTKETILNDLCFIFNNPSHHLTYDLSLFLKFRKYGKAQRTNCFDLVIS